VVRTHQADSRVKNAIKSADYIQFRQLLERQEVSPFDLVDYSDHPTGNSIPLFEIVAMVFDTCSQESKFVMQKGLFAIARLLADSGVDCGAGDSLYSVLSSMFIPNELAIRLFHIIMAHSQSDPFNESARIRRLLAYSGIKPSTIAKQDAWDLSEFRVLFEDHWGKGLFQGMVENEV
jgi:hypothetical protein